MNAAAHRYELYLHDKKCDCRKGLSSEQCSDVKRHEKALQAIVVRSLKQFKEGDKIWVPARVTDTSHFPFGEGSIRAQVIGHYKGANLADFSVHMIRRRKPWRRRK